MKVVKRHNNHESNNSNQEKEQLDNKPIVSKFDVLRRLLQESSSFAPNNKENSYYRQYSLQDAVLQVRISNHGTYLQTWKGTDRDDPSLSTNISIVISNDAKVDSNLNVESESKRPFHVQQYVYDENKLSAHDIRSIYNAIILILQRKKFIDPLSTTDRKAVYSDLESNYIPIDQTKNKSWQINTKKQKSKNPIKRSLNKKQNENKIHMKQTIRLTESQLKRMIKQCINEAKTQYSKVYVVEEGDGIYNVFSSDDFDKDGYLYGYNGQEGYHFDDFDIVKVFYNADAAFRYAEKLTNELAIRNGYM